MRSLAGSVAGALLLLNSCGVPRGGTFRVLPGKGDYLLRAPDAREEIFPDTLRTFNGFVRGGKDGMDLRPGMELRIENAYYEVGKPKQGLNGFLGTEIARYRAAPRGGLKLISLQSMKQRPADQPPVNALIAHGKQHFRCYKFYFEILFKNRSQGSVLIGANSTRELANLTAALAHDPEQVCRGNAPHCVVFPEACSVAAEMQIIVNGKPQSVIWGSTLAGVLKNPEKVTMRRRYRGQWVPVQFDARDPNALRLPLLPGDSVDWK